MATVPPTPADVDAWFTQPGGGAEGLVAMAFDQPSGQPLTTWILAWTRNDGTPAYTQVNDPTSDEPSAWTAAGLTAQYGQITVRAYTYTAAGWPVPPTADLLLPDAEQTRLNDPANWLAP